MFTNIGRRGLRLGSRLLDLELNTSSLLSMVRNDGGEFRILNRPGDIVV